MKSAKFRELYSHENGRAPLAELPMVGWARHSQARVPGLGAHAHPGAFELFLIERGWVEWWVEDEVHRLPANNIYINRPGERHGSLGRSFKPCGYMWLQMLLPAVIPAAPELQGLHDEFRAFSLRSFASSSATKEAFRVLWAMHREPPAHPEVALRAQLHLLLVQVVHDHRAALAAHQSHRKRLECSFAIRQALRVIDGRLSEITSVAELAAASGLGQTQFGERFIAEVGVTPSNYLRRQRIEQTKDLLRRGGQTLTAIAHATGFSSSQHLSTVFKQIEGTTPTEFLRQQAEQTTTEVAPTS
jgi:AraC-like DNA-binding protein